jgi:hypothetical protein
MSTVDPPAPDPKLKPEPADEAAEQGDRERPVLTAPSPPDGSATGRDPQFARNGE